jgi:hypothetical protein
MATEPRPRRSPWEDPNVKEALKDRAPDDIALLCCPRCDTYGYYNEGSHFTCGACRFSASGGRLDAMIENGEVITLDDYAEAQASEEGYPV